MNTTPSSQTGSGAAATVGLQPAGGVPGVVAPGTQPAGSASETRQTGYGLPCAKCRTYYSANLLACPVCKNPERVSPTSAPALKCTEAAEVIPDANALEEERDRFLRQFKSQVYSSHMQINAAESFRCSLEDNHQGGFEPASVCKTCYENLQARADQLEAALHIDLKEATQLIYDAVWADPADPGKTYTNAAQALLTELRNRAGISAVLGPLQTMQH
jgi:hypothetical protein